MTTARAWALVVVGYSLLALAMISFLTFNGVSAAAAGTITTAGLIGLGLVLPAAGMLELARHMGPSEGAARKGLVLQSLGLMGLLIGLVVTFIASSLAGDQASAAFIVLSGISGLFGATFISKAAGKMRLLVVSAVLIAVGAALIPASNIALTTYWILQTDKNIYQDIGATIAACGCVLAAYALFVIRERIGTSEAPTRGGL